jgi:hypothetical protein
MREWLRYLLAGLALALAYFALMYAIGGVYWCDDPTAFNPLAPPIGVCR